MKKLKLYFLGLALSTLLIPISAQKKLVVSGGLPPLPISACFDYYHFDGIRIPIVKREFSYVIEKDVSVIERKSIQDILLQEGFREFRVKKVGYNDRNELHLVSFSNTTNSTRSSSLETRMQQVMLNHASISFVSIKYEYNRRPGLYMTPLEPIYVQFDANVTYAEMITLGNAAGLTMIGLDVDDLDNDIYEFKRQNSTSNLICVANELFENGRVQFAEPNMLF
ncbi:MAG: hypothetical protein JKY48_09875, partial [Flavobacteriales bacterium]|nr:hypothetical protein [Flavobacteriales bacterium]